MNSEHKTRFERMNRSSFVLYVQDLVDEETEKVVQAFKVKALENQKRSENMYIVELGVHGNPEGKEFAMEKGFVPSQQKLPVIVFYDTMDDDFFHYTYVMEGDITQDNLKKHMEEYW